MNRLKDVLVVIRHSELFYTIIMTHWRGEAFFLENLYFTNMLSSLDFYLAIDKVIYNIWRRNNILYIISYLH